MATVMVPPALLVMPPTVAISCPPLATVIAPLLVSDPCSVYVPVAPTARVAPLALPKVESLVTAPPTLNVPPALLG